MTDDVGRQADVPKEATDEVGALPSIPNDYATLKSLIQSLPRPLPPELHQARSAPPTTEAPSSVSMQLSTQLAGVPIGTESGSAIGVYPSMFPYNLLKDPTWDSFVSGLALTSSDVAVAYGVGASWAEPSAAWYAKWASTYGSVASSSCGYTWTRQHDDAASSSAMTFLKVRAAGAGTHEVMLRSCDITPQWGEWGTYLVGAVRLMYLSDNGNRTNLTSATVVTELYNVTKAAVRHSVTWTTPTPTVAGWESINQLQTVYYKAAAAGEAYDSWQLRFRLIITTSSSMTSIMEIGLVEPRLAWSSSASAGPFSPMLSGWMPNQVVSSQQASATIVKAYVHGESFARFRASTNGYLTWGGGGLDLDCRIYRGQAGRLVVDSNTANAWTELGIIATSGQRAKVDVKVSGDSYPRSSLWGDGTMQGLEFGDGTNAVDTNLYRSQASRLKTDDEVEIGRVNAGDTALMVRRGSDTYAAWMLFGDGKQEWGAGGSSLRDTNLYRSAANLLATDDALYAAGNVLSRRYANGNVTLVSANTWYKIPLTGTVPINPLYTGQRFLVCWSGSCNYPTAGATISVGVAIDNDTSGTNNTWVAVQNLLPATGVNGAFGGSAIWTAAAGDVGNTRYAYLYGSATTASSTTLTVYNGAAYATRIDVIALP